MLKNVKEIISVVMKTVNICDYIYQNVNYKLFLQFTQN